MKKKTTKSKNQSQENEKFIQKNISESEKKLAEQLIVQLQQIYQNDNVQKEIIEDVTIKLQDLIIDFNNIPINDLQQAIGSSKLEYIEGGTTIFKIGDKADKFYVLLQGICSVSIQTPNQKQQSSKFNVTEVKRLEQFSTFGELGLIHKNGLRSSNVIAKIDCVLISMPKETYNQNIKKDVMQELDILWQSLKKVSYLQHWNERDIANLIYKLSTKKFNFHQTVYQRGESSNSGIFFVVKGEFEVQRQLEVDVLTEKERQAVNSIRPDLAGQKKQVSVQIAVVSSGNTFGEDEVMLHKERINNVICISEGAEAYVITKQEFEKKILWDEETKKCVTNLVKSRQEWASQKMEEYKKTLELSKPMMMSRKLSNDSLNIVEQESHFQNVDHSPLSRSSLQSRGKIIHEIKQRRQSLFFDLQSPIKNNNNLTNELQFQRSSSKQNQDEAFFSQEEMIALAILKDQNKIMGSEQNGDDIVINSKGNNTPLKIRKEYSFNDQMNQLLVENTVRTQQFEAINNKIEEVNKFSNQTASYLANLATVKHNILPELDEDYKKQKGENLVTYIDRIRKISFVKRVKEERKSILSSELNNIYKKYCNGENVQLNINSNLQSQSNQNQFVDFNFARNVYNDQKIEELQQRQQKKQQNALDKSPKSPQIQYNQFSSQKNEKIKQNNKNQIHSNRDRQASIDEILQLDERLSQQKTTLKNNKNEQPHTQAISNIKKKQSFQEDDFQNDVSDLILEDNDSYKNDLNKKQKLKLNIQRSSKMKQYFQNQEKNEKLSKQNELKHSPNLSSFQKNIEQYNFVNKLVKGDSNDGIQNTQYTIQNNDSLEQDKRSLKQPSLILSQSQIYSSPQYAPVKVPILRNLSEKLLTSKVTPLRQKQQQNDQYSSYQQQSQQQLPQLQNSQSSLLKYMKIDPTQVLQTKCAFLSHRPLVRQINRKKYSGHDDGDTEIDQEYFNRDQNINVYSEQSSPCIQPFNNLRQSSINFNRGYESQTLQTVGNNNSRLSLTNLQISQLMKTQQDSQETCLDQQKNSFKPSKYFTKSYGLTKQILDKIQPNNIVNKANPDIRPRVNSYNQQEIQQKLQQVNQYKYDIVIHENQKSKSLNRKNKAKSSLIGNGSYSPPKDFEKMLLITRNMYMN